MHPKLVRVFDNRAKLWAGGEADWALGEALAYGTLLLEGRDVRLAGQDTRRGTFGHRNAAVVDYLTGAEYVPLAALGPGRFSIYDSLLSEYAAARLRVRLLAGGPGRPGGLGGPVRRLRQRRPDRHRPVPRRRRDQVGADVGTDPAAAARLRGAGRGALLGPHGALPGPVRRGQHAGGRRDHAQPSSFTCCAGRCCGRPGSRSSCSLPSGTCGPRRRTARRPSSPAAISGRCSTTRMSADRAAVRRVVLATGKVALDAFGGSSQGGPRRRQRGPHRAALPLAGRPDRGRSWPATREPRTSSGCRKNRRTWGPGTSCGTASTTSSGPTSASTGWPGWPRVRPQPVAMPCTSWSRPTCWPEPWVDSHCAAGAGPPFGGPTAARSARGAVPARARTRSSRQAAFGPLRPEAPSPAAPGLLDLRRHASSPRNRRRFQSGHRGTIAAESGRSSTRPSGSSWPRTRPTW